MPESGPCLSGIAMILLDIEGTTTPISFVYDVLFPYARRNIQRFMESNRDDPAVVEIVEKLRQLHDSDVAASLSPPDWRNGREHTVEDSVSYCKWLMEKDSKSGPLKEIQGLMWKEGYASGELRGRVYPDVKPALERWTSKGIDVCIYSSGSVLGQKLLFSTTDQGDLTLFIRDFFDTRVGAKVSGESYRKIASRSGYGTDQILFLSDREGELEAARSVGASVVLVSRDSGNSREDVSLRVIKSFDEIE